MARISRFWDVCEEYEKSISTRFKNSKVGTFINKYKGFLRNGIFIVLLWQKTVAVDTADDFRRANEVLVNHAALASSKYESNEITRWKKLMLGSMNDPSFIMVEVSPSYENKFLTVFGLALGDYLGRSDFMVWPEEIAQEFFNEDLYVARTGIPLYAIGTNPTGGKLYIIKERVIENDRIYIVGAAIDMNRANGWEEARKRLEEAKANLKKELKINP